MSIKFNFSFFLLFFFPPLGHYLLLVLIWSDSMTTTSLWSHSTREMNRIILYDVVINKSDYSWRDYIYIYIFNSKNLRTLGNQFYVNSIQFTSDICRVDLSFKLHCVPSYNKKLNRDRKWMKHYSKNYIINCELIVNNFLTFWKKT